MKKYLILLIISTSFGACTIIMGCKNKLIPAGEEPVKISFSSWEGAILLKAEINGQEGTFIFDNGFSKSVMSHEFADKLSIRFDKKSTVTDANNRKRALPKTIIDTVSIKGQIFINTEFYLLDTRKLFPCKSIDGIIGASIINLINWEIDFSKNILKLSSLPFESSGLKMKVEIQSNNTAFTTITLNKINVRTQIDFGNTTDELQLNLEHTSKYFKGFKVIEKRGIKSISAHGPGDPILFFQLANKMQIETTGIILPVEAKTSIVENLKHGGYLGVNYFRNYEKVVINSTNEEYFLSGNNAWVNPAFKEIKTYGLVLYPVDNTWQVIQIDNCNPLLKNINLYDKVFLLDDKPISRFNDICEYKEYLERKRQNEEIFKITLKDNTEYEIHFEEPIPVLMN